MRIWDSWRRFDLALFGTAMLLAVVGLVLVYSASHHSNALGHLVWKQLLWLAMGTLMLSFFFIVDYQSLVHGAYLFYGAVLLLLVLLVLFGRQSTGGSARWFNLGLFYVQPSELAKLALILAMTRWVSEHDREIKTFWGLLPPLGLMGLMMGLILKQPDLGTALVLFPVAFVILLVAGARLWHLGLILFMGLASTPLLWHFLKDYQRRRWISFIQPESDALGAGYNAIQSGIAIGSGGFFGKGFLQGTQSQLNFVPMHHTDFIFSVLAEEWGWLGCAVVLGLYLALLLQAVKISVSSKDLRGTLLGSGVVAMLTTQVIFNVGMTSGVLPVTGITLPLLSYGGSSVVTVMICLGILLNIRRESSGA
ncbi:MAG: rod shape-determining protein RodA [candidate division FCPU426 bacterium]